MQKRPLVILAGVLVAILALVAFAVVALMQGGAPLIHGEKLAGGRVEIVADGFIAAYIVRLDDGGVALVDAGFDPEATSILTALEAAGRSSADVRAIFLTHGHGDHIAGALAFPGAELFALSADVDLVEGRRVADNLLGRGKTATPTGLTVDRILDDGDRFEIGGTTVEVFAVPGHSRGSAAFLIHEVLFLGDSAGAARDGTITAAPPIFSADRQQNRRSLVALAERLSRRRDAIDDMVFGHQGPLRGIDPLLEWAERNP